MLPLSYSPKVSLAIILFTVRDVSSFKTTPRIRLNGKSPALKSLQSQVRQKVTTLVRLRNCVASSGQSHPSTLFKRLHLHRQDITLHSTTVDSFSWDTPLSPSLYAAPFLWGGQAKSAACASVPATAVIKYEMIPLPDSILYTTVFVGNLNEFVTDEKISDLFAQVSVLRTVPCAVARRIDTSSMRYAFVTFLNKDERDRAIEAFHGYELDGNALLVEPIREDGPRVRVPGKLVSYTCGEEIGERESAATQSKRVRATSGECGTSGKNKGGAPTKQKARKNQLRRVSKDDVLRLSRGQAAKKRGYGSRGVAHRLNENERAAFERAERHCYVTLEGTGYRRGRKGSPLANIHRQWCDARAKPQIVLCKASSGRILDNLIVDLSPLRVAATKPLHCSVNFILNEYKAQVLTTASKTGMVLISEYDEDNTMTVDESKQDTAIEPSGTTDVEAWATMPIFKLPSIRVGVFEGERSVAKAMAKDLAAVWEIKGPL